MRRWALSIAILVAFAVFSLQVAAAEPQMGQPQVVFVMDLSGSVLEADSEKYFIDALKLGVDLAPYGAELALITVNDKIVAETSLMGMDDELNRAAIKEAISQITCSGNTNFTAGLTRALELLQASPNTSQNKRIVFLGDFNEGGFAGATSGNEKEAENLEAFAAKAKAQNVQVDLILIRDPPKGSITASVLGTLPEKTGGRLYRLAQAKDFPKAVEDIYFSSFSTRAARKSMCTQCTATRLHLRPPNT